MYKRIAIDGPVGAGKSTIARECAKRLGYIYVDTGALYRAVGYYAVKNGIDTDNEDVLFGGIDGKLSLTVEIKNSVQRVYANGEDCTERIRTPEMSMTASKVSAYPKIRKFLLDLQRGIAEKNNVIMDGRDIGTVILPNAEVKIFLTAKPEERAKRRYDELIAKGESVEYGDVLADLQKRDFNDSNRSAAPLKQADDAVLLDTSGLSFEESVEKVISLIQSCREGN